MGSVTASTTFGDLPGLGMEVVVTCQKCGKKTAIDGREESLRRRRVVGARYRCDQPGCHGIGLPTLGKERRWTQKLAEHARSLKSGKEDDL